MKAWLKMAEYCERFNTTKYRVLQDIENGRLKGIQEVKKGHWKIEVDLDNNEELRAEMEEIKQMLKAIMKHNGIKVLNNERSKREK